MRNICTRAGHCLVYSSASSSRGPIVCAGLWACRPRSTDVLAMLNHLAAEAKEPSTFELLGPVLRKPTAWNASDIDSSTLEIRSPRS